MRATAKKILLLISLALPSLIFTNQAVFATSGLTVSISSNLVSMSLAPGLFGTASQTISVSATNASGYHVGITTTGTSSALVNQSDSSKTIPTFALPSGSSSIPVASLGDGYGYSVDNGANFYPVPEPSLPPVELFRTSSAGSGSHTLTFGAQIPLGTVAGTYSNTFNIVVVANLETCPAGSICYYGNGDDGTGTMGNQSANSNSDVTLLASNFSRSGYGFVGWNTAIDGTGTNYGPNQTITTGDLSSEGLQLYAKWVQSSGNLQNWNGCSTMTAIAYHSTSGEFTIAPNSITALTDTRDGSTYAVAKYPDGQCWMMENLRLDLSDPDLEISDLNTNRPTTSFAQYIDNNHPSSTNNFCANNNAACIDQVLYNTNNTNRSLTASYDANNTSSSWYSYGNYYNWYTITAGNGTYSLSVGGAGADGDICPASWRLPSGYGNVGDLSALDRAMGGNGDNQISGSQAGLSGSVRWRTFPMNFIYSGEQKGNTAANRNVSSSNATLSATNADRTANLWLKADGVYMNSNSTPKVRGQTVRCVFNAGYHIEGNIHYDANGGTGTMPDETNVNFSTDVAANNSFTKNYSTFDSWNTAADGSGVVVAEGGMVANAANHMGITDGGTLTLYAIWRSEYSLVYDGNGADAGSMINAEVYNLNLGKRALVASNFSRAGYGFAGWSLDSNAGSKLLNGQAVTVYGPNQIITVDSAFLANADQINQITLYAVWLPEDSTYTMQSFGPSECGLMASGSIMALKDTRDNNVYSVARLEDGNCWMVENLRLDPSTTTFNNSNTNSPTSDFITKAGNSATSNTLCNTDDSTCVDTVRFNSNNIDPNLSSSYNTNVVNKSWYSYGIMYNWYTASAGNGTFAMSSGNVTGDICPAGWRLPTGGSSGEFITLNNLANGGSTTVDTGLVKFPDNFIYSGDFNYNLPGGRGSYGRYWSATPNGTTKAYRLGVISSGATPTGSWNKWDAFAVRCIVTGATIPTFTVTGNPSNWTNQDVTMTIVPDDPGTYEYSFDGGSTWQNSASHTFSSNQTIDMKIRTMDGIKSRQVTETISKIDKTPPTISFASSTEYNSDHTTKQVTTLITTLGDNNSVTTGVTVSDDLSGVATGYPKCYRNNNEIASTSIFTDVGRYEITCKAQDEVGNEATANREVLVRWPTGGKYVVKKTQLDGADIAGVGHSSSASPDGLYQDTSNTGYNSALPFSSKYYYAGANVDNYVSFANSTFRILNVAENDDIKVLGSISDQSVAWGSALQTTKYKIYNSDIYSAWSTVWWVNGQIYNQDANESKYKLFSNTEKAHIALATFYAGRVNDNDNIAAIISSEQTNTSSLGGDSAAFEGYSAYPNVSDFLKACKAHDIFDQLEDIDTGSVLSQRTTFTNNSWVDMTAGFWTMNGRTGTLPQNSDFWVIDNDMGGHFESRLYSNTQQYRVVFYITDATILSGDGSSSTPYTVEEDWAWFDSYQVLE